MIASRIRPAEITKRIRSSTAADRHTRAASLLSNPTYKEVKVLCSTDIRQKESITKNLTEAII